MSVGTESNESSVANPRVFGPSPLTYLRFILSVLPTFEQHEGPQERSSDASPLGDEGRQKRSSAPPLGDAVLQRAISLPNICRCSGISPLRHAKIQLCNLPQNERLFTVQAAAERYHNRREGGLERVGIVGSLCG